MAKRKRPYSPQRPYDDTSHLPRVPGGGPRPRVFLIAGEESGDMHGALLVHELRRLCPYLKLEGLGGDHMKAAGVKLLHNITKDLAIIGLMGIVTNFRRIKRVFDATIQHMEKYRPDAIILIDYPGFNLRVMKEAHRLGIKVIYYISPQVWAWRRRRIYEIARCVDKMMVIFPFEEKMYRELGVDVAYVGHPLMDHIHVTMTRAQVFRKHRFDMDKRLIGLMPGSRKSEVTRLLPIMVEAAERIAERDPDVQFVLPKAGTISRRVIEKYLSRGSVDIRVVDTDLYDVRSALDFAIVKSGTSTLETAILGTPMLIVYKVNWLTWLIGKSLVKIPHIGLVNVVAGEGIVPEFLQGEAKPLIIAEETLRLLNTPEELNYMRDQLERVKDKLRIVRAEELDFGRTAIAAHARHAEGGASLNAALEVLKTLDLPPPLISGDVGAPSKSPV
jgi:lipid-A-disaccharide synthase